MNSFYEVRKNENQILVRRNASYEFPPHFHLDLEVVVVRRGRQAVRVNGVEYAVENGGVIVIDSYDVHEYQKGKEGDGDDCVVVIPYRYLSVWNERRGDFRVANPVIEDEKLSDELLRIVDGYLRKEDSETVKVAAMGLFLARLAQCVEFTGQKENDERTLMRKILAYVQGNFREDATLKAVARALGYTEAHISRVFHRYIKTGLSKYVNGLRLEYIDGLKKKGDKRKMTELIYEAGFKSQQTYYRCRANVK